LVTGPTGSGKSTSIYAMLEQINDGKKKIITVEDPVEYQMSGITQIQVQEEIDYTFARALRSILRQDPDVVMIGEIRDLETAEIAVQASLTGHLVLTTLHTNDAASAFTRLIDMGIEPFLIATPVRAVIAQRLVRRLCQHCAVSHGPLPEIIARVETILPEHLRHAKPQWRQSGNVSCVHCQGTGYRGRIGIYEIIKVDSEVQKMILDGTSVDSMWASLQKNGCRSLRQDGLLKARQGLTSIEEVLRVTAE
jgi:general secretion pathway protein E